MKDEGENGRERASSTDPVNANPIIVRSPEGRLDTWLTSQPLFLNVSEGCSYDDLQSHTTRKTYYHELSLIPEHERQLALHELLILVANYNLFLLYVNLIKNFLENAASSWTSMDADLKIYFTFFLKSLADNRDGSRTFFRLDHQGVLLVVELELVAKCIATGLWRVDDQRIAPGDVLHKMLRGADLGPVERCRANFISKCTPALPIQKQQTSGQLSSKRLLDEIEIIPPSKKSRNTYKTITPPARLPRNSDIIPPSYTLPKNYDIIPQSYNFSNSYDSVPPQLRIPRNWQIISRPGKKFSTLFCNVCNESFPRKDKYLQRKLGARHGFNGPRCACRRGDYDEYSDEE